MRDQKRTGTRLFFIEFLIVLFFFFLVSTVCLKLFAAAHQLTVQAEALSQAQTLASSAVETLKAKQESLTAGQSVSYFDQSFTSCSESEAAYSMTVTVTPAAKLSAASEFSVPTLYTVTVAVTRPDGSSVYTLSTSLHRPIHYEELCAVPSKPTEFRRSL